MGCDGDDRRSTAEIRLASRVRLQELANNGKRRKTREEMRESTVNTFNIKF
jgi:hypothetical protein